MSTTLIKNALIINENTSLEADLRISSGRIEKIGPDLSATVEDKVIDAQGCWLLPGMIDDQVHFREPGMTHKGTIASESAAAVAGGITSYMEMPNVSPATTNQAALANKYQIAERGSLANYAFYLGATEDNLDEIKALDPRTTCGVKVFMGASTGDLLVENPTALEGIFRESPVLIVTHCESGPVMQKNMQAYEARNQTPTIYDHPIIRDAEACYASSSYAVGLARTHGTQLHVLHITTEKELSLFASGPVHKKQITAEACVHHLWFSDQDYALRGNQIKCNPAVKSEQDRNALLAAVRNNQIDIIATDHAPHTWAEKQQAYPQAPAGLPLVEHALLSLIDQVNLGHLNLHQVVEKTAHNPALRYAVENRGFIREGYFADLVLVDPQQSTLVNNDKVRYLCQWSPFAGHRFNSRILSTWVNGEQVFDGEQTRFIPSAAQVLRFYR